MPTDSSPSPNNNWMRYAGMAGQMLVTLGLGVWLGMWLDGKTAMGFPIFALSIPVLLLVGILWQLIKDTNPNNKKRKR